jgi:hypothetical protein
MKIKPVRKFMISLTVLNDVDIFGCSVSEVCHKDAEVDDSVGQVPEGRRSDRGVCSG